MFAVKTPGIIERIHLLEHVFPLRGLQFPFCAAVCNFWVAVDPSIH